MDKKRINRLILKIIMVALCVAMSVISYIFLFHLPKYILVIIVALLASMGVSIACVNDLKHEAIFKALLTAIVGAAIILAVYIILDLTGVLDKITSFEVLKQFVLDTKQWGIIVFILLTVFQVVVLPIPSMVTVLKYSAKSWLPGWSERKKRTNTPSSLTRRGGLHLYS